MYMSEFLSRLRHRIQRLAGSLPPAKYCSAPQYTIGMPTEVMAMTWQALWCFFLSSQLPPQLRVLALSWLSQKLAMQLRALESRLLAHWLQQFLRLYMSFWLKRVSLTQKKKGQLRQASSGPTYPPTQPMSPSNTSPTEQTPAACANWLQNHLGTSGTVSILMPSMLYLETRSEIQERRVVRTQSFSCLRSASWASLQFSILGWFLEAKSWSVMSHQSWQWEGSLKGVLTPKLVSRLPMWLPTTSTMTRMPLPWQALTRSTKSLSVPKLSLSLQMFLPQQPWQPPSRLSMMGEIQMASNPMPWMQSRLLMMPRQPPPQQQPE